MLRPQVSIPDLRTKIWQAMQEKKTTNSEDTDHHLGMQVLVAAESSDPQGSLRGRISGTWLDIANGMVLHKQLFRSHPCVASHSRGPS